MGLDAVELLLEWEDTFGIHIEDAEAERIRTVGDAVDLVASKVALGGAQVGPCPTLSAYLRLQELVAEVTGAPSQRWPLRTPMRRVRAPLLARDFWPRFREASGLEDVEPWPWPRCPEPRVRDLVWRLAPAFLPPRPGPGEPWSRAHARILVRWSIRRRLALTRPFPDHAGLIDELGLS
ncbi:MAG: acyl carrier protein [Sandaracinaceae bacterium]